MIGVGLSSSEVTPQPPLAALSLEGGSEALAVGSFDWLLDDSPLVGAGDPALSLSSGSGPLSAPPLGSGLSGGFSGVGAGSPATLACRGRTRK